MLHINVPVVGICGYCVSGGGDRISGGVYGIVVKFSFSGAGGTEC